MALARYVVDAVLLEGRSAREVAAAHGISKSWIYVLIERFRAGGYEALEPRSRRPRSCSHQTPPGTVQRILALRRELAAQGYDCGPVTIGHHLERAGLASPSTGTIWRVLKRHGLITPQPQKRPRLRSDPLRSRSAERAVASRRHRLAARRRSAAEILNLIDDHSRLLLGSDAYERVKAADVVASFHKAAQLHGLPDAMLSDNGAVFTGSYRKGKVLLESELERLGVLFKNSRPYHPQTCGKVERLHQTLKRYLTKQPPPATLTELQTQLDAFAHYYNDVRPHRALGGRTPLQAYSARIKAKPASAPATTHFRVREDKVDKTGKVSLRYDSKLYKIGVGRAHKGRTIKLLIADQQIRVIDPNGELLRELTLDPSRTYQPITQD